LDALRHRGRQFRLAPHVVLARRGEDLAHRFAQETLGWRVIGRNYRHPVRRLEIDMVAVAGDTLIVTEVKTRSADEQSHPLRAVDDDKIRHIGAGARAWVRKAQALGMSIRFDVITVVIPAQGLLPKIEHHPDVSHLVQRLAL
jgi:putative endonuclease